MRAITLWQPHASLIFLPEKVGPKRIETRTHDRFRGLAGERIAIHAASRVPTLFELDRVGNQLLRLEALRAAVWVAQYMLDRSGGGPRSAVLGTALVREFRELTEADERAALCQITDNRFGLVLDEVFAFREPVPAKGNRGIWHWQPPAEVARAEREFLAGLKGGD